MYKLLLCVVFIQSILFISTQNVPEPHPSPQPTSDTVPPPQPTSDIPSPQPTSDVPPPQPTSDVPPPQPTSDIPPPQPTSDIPSPQPTSDVPYPQPTSDIPSPQPTSDVPPPQPTSDIPSPQPTSDVPSPQPTSDVPPPQPKPQPQPQPFSPKDPDYKEHVDMGLSIALIVVGLVWLFFGSRFQDSVTMFSGGFVVLYFIVYILLDQFVVTRGMIELWVGYIIAAIGGIIGGFLFVILKNSVGNFLFGSLLGILFSTLIFSTTPLGTVALAALYQMLIILGIGLALGIITVILPKMLLVVATAFNGSYLVWNSLDHLFIKSGTSDVLRNLLSNVQNSEALKYTGNTLVYAVLAGVLVITIVGIIIQFRLTRKQTENDFNREDTPLLQIEV